MEQKYKIGEGSSYDVDMNLIEMFIRAKNNTHNELSQTALNEYYISQIYAYWDTFIRRIEMDVINLDKDDHYNYIFENKNLRKTSEVTKLLNSDLNQIRMVKYNITLNDIVQILENEFGYNLQKSDIFNNFEDAIQNYYKIPYNEDMFIAKTNSVIF